MLAQGFEVVIPQLVKFLQHADMRVPVEVSSS